MLPPLAKPRSIIFPWSSLVKSTRSFKFIANSPSANTEAAGRAPAVLLLLNCICFKVAISPLNNSRNLEQNP